MKPAEMTQFFVISFTVNMATVLCCVVVGGMLIRFAWKRPAHLPPWVALPIALGVFTTAGVHAVHTWAWFGQARLCLLVADAVHALSMMMVLCVVWEVTTSLLEKPSIGDLKSVNDELARKIGEISERQEAR